MGQSSMATLFYFGFTHDFGARANPRNKAKLGPRTLFILQWGDILLSIHPVYTRSFAHIRIGHPDVRTENRELTPANTQSMITLQTH